MSGKRGGPPAAQRPRPRSACPGTLTPPQPRPGGRGCLTGGKDPEQVGCWCREFCVDVGEQSSIDLIDAGSWDDSRFGDRYFTIWEIPDGAAVSTAAATSAVGGMVRVDPVHTPARLRGRGYAGTVTVEVSRAAPAAEAMDVVLFTDPANRTSNRPPGASGTSTSPTSSGTSSPTAPHKPVEVRTPSDPACAALTRMQTDGIRHVPLFPDARGPA